MIKKRRKVEIDEVKVSAIPMTIELMRKWRRKAISKRMIREKKRRKKIGRI